MTADSLHELVPVGVSDSVMIMVRVMVSKLLWSDGKFRVIVRVRVKSWLELQFDPDNLPFSPKPKLTLTFNNPTKLDVLVLPKKFA